MLELLSLVGIALIAATVIERFTSTKSSKEHPDDTPSGDVKRVIAAPALQVRSADADGTQQVPRDARFSFVSGFGVRPEQLKELHIYSVAGSLDHFPTKVRDLLKKLYDNGYAVGEELMAVLHHGRPLKEGEAIYVAVAQDDRANLTRTVAFLDRRRAC